MLKCWKEHWKAVYYDTHLFSKAEQDLTSLTKKVQDCDMLLFKKEELRASAMIKLGRASELGDDAKRYDEAQQKSE